MKSIYAAVLASFLSACAPRFSTTKPPQSDPVKLASAPAQLKPVEPFVEPKDIDVYVKKHELEAFLNQIIANGIKIILSDVEGTEEFKHQTCFIYSKNDVQEITSLTYQERSVSFCKKINHDDDIVYSIDVSGTFTVRQAGKQMGPYRIVLHDGYFRHFDERALTFRHVQTELDGFPEIEDDGNPSDFAVIINEEPQTWQYGATGPYLALMASIIREVASLHKGPTTIKLDSFPQSLGYPLYTKNQYGPRLHPQLPKLPNPGKDPENSLESRIFF